MAATAACPRRGGRHGQIISVGIALGWGAGARERTGNTIGNAIAGSSLNSILISLENKSSSWLLAC